MKKMLAFLMVLAIMVTSFAGFALAEGDRFIFDRSVTELFIGDTLTLTMERAGNAAEGTVTFKSSATQNATVDENGTVTGLKKGQTTITATLENNGRSFRANITLTIKQRVEKVSLDETKVTLHDATEATIASLLTQSTTNRVLLVPMGQSLSAPTLVEPTTANDRTAVLESSDSNVLRVQGHSLTPVKAGECELTVSSKQNPEVTATYHVLVVTPARIVKPTLAEETLWVGETTQATAAITPADASITDVTWTSRNESVATVDANGVVTAVSKGSAYIVAAAVDGSGRMGNVTVRVKQQPTAITLSSTDLVVNMGQAQNLRATVAPTNADDKKVTWESSDPSVATVNNSGRITPVSVGEATITCRSTNFPSVYATCKVTVNQLVEKVIFSTKTVTVDVGSTITVAPQITPANATNQSVTYKTSNANIATVDADGTVHGVKRGTVTITATAADGSKRSGTIKVSVLQPVTGVHMYSDTIRVDVRESVTGRAVLEPTDASNLNMTWTSADPSIATVKGKQNRPTVTGVRWGETTITGVTEDGGYTTTATIMVGNYDKALKIVDLYLQDNKIKLNVRNDSNMNITRFYFTLTCYDVYGNPLPVTSDGNYVMNCSYRLALGEGEMTQHGRFNFDNYVQPVVEIGKVVMNLTGYRTEDGYSRNIQSSKQPTAEIRSPNYVGQ